MKLVSWDGNNINDGTNYDAVLNANFYGLPGIRAILGYRHGNWPILGSVDRPGRELNFDIYIRSGSSLELAQWFDPEDETSKQLIVEDSDGSNDRFVNAICTEFREVPFSAGLQYAVTVQVVGDVRWGKITLDNSGAWNITASGDTKAVSNDGQDITFPTFLIEPTGARSSGGFAYKLFTVVRWNSEYSAINYPTDIVNNGFDTASLTTAKMQADGDDLRTYVDGVEVDRWLQDMDTATTQVWCNLDFDADVPMTLNGAHSDSVTDIDVNEDISYMPYSGIIYIGTELITYTSKNNQQKRFSGCTRGTKGTSAAAHSDTDGVYWIQHDIWIYYGNSSLSAPTVDDDYKPMFELDSTNASWDYNDFKETVKPTRPGSWQTQVQSEGIEFYGGNQGAAADPYVEVGVHADYTGQVGYFFLGNPCGIISANFQNGEHYHETKSYFWGRIYSNPNTGGTPGQWVIEYDIPDPTTDATWDIWSRNETLDSGSKAVALYLWGVSDEDAYVEAADVTLTIDDDPTIIMGSEQSNYTLSCRITNNTTGDAIDLNWGMGLNDVLEVDSEEKIVIDWNNIPAFNALDLIGGARKNWIPLVVGSNTLQFDDVGTGNVTIWVTWRERYYE